MSATHPVRGLPKGHPPISDASLEARVQVVAQLFDSLTYDTFAVLEEIGEAAEIAQ